MGDIFLTCYNTVENRDVPICFFKSSDTNEKYIFGGARYPLLPTRQIMLVIFSLTISSGVMVLRGKFSFLIFTNRIGIFFVNPEIRFPLIINCSKQYYQIYFFIVLFLYCNIYVVFH